MTTAVPGESGRSTIQTCVNAAAGACRPRPLIDPTTEGQPDDHDHQKKPANPIAHLTPEDIEQLGVELDAIRQDVLDSRGARDAAYIRKVIAPSAASSSAAARCCCSASSRRAWVLGTAGLSRRQDPRQHGDRPQRHARPVGLDARPEDPLHHLGVGQRLRRPSSGSTRHNEMHHTYTNVVGKDNDLGYGIMRVDEDQPWTPSTSRQPLWNFINACFFEYGIAAYDLELGEPSIAKKRTEDPELPAPRQAGARQDPQAGHQGLRRPPGALGPDRLVPADPRGQRDRQPGPQPVDPLGDHVRPLPRGRRDLRASSSIEDETRGEWYLRQMLGSANISGSRRCT